MGVTKYLREAWKKPDNEVLKKRMIEWRTGESIVRNRNTFDLCEAAYTPIGYESPIWFLVSGNTTGIVIPGEEPPLVISITSSATSERLRKYFMSLWKNRG